MRHPDHDPAPGDVLRVRDPRGGHTDYTVIDVAAGEVLYRVRTICPSGREVGDHPAACSLIAWRTVTVRGASVIKKGGET